ncbi:MAG: ATP-grasp domain-containing protein [Eubacterium sp.]|nr:ATP-grasp domain-containing protein [Eubacterium sp.]
MNAWLIYDREGAERNRDYIEYHHEVGARYGVTFHLVYADELPGRISACLHGSSSGDDMGTEPGHLGACAHPDFAIVRTIAPQINEALEAEGIPTYNNSKVSRITNHKYRCIEYIAQHTDVPTIPTTLLACPPADLHPGDVTKPVSGHGGSPDLSLIRPGDVIKPVSGHGGAGVMRVPEDGLSKVQQSLLSSGEYIRQPFIEGPGEDVRVYVIGDRIIAAVCRHARADDFRANASLGGQISPYHLNETETNYVNQIIHCFKFGLVGIDFIIDNNNQFIFNEIEDVVGARMLYKTHPEIDILDSYIYYIIT